jgi:hypothetical protein
MVRGAEKMLTIYRNELMHYFHPIWGYLIAFLKISRNRFGDCNKLRSVPADLVPIVRSGFLDPVIEFVNMRDDLDAWPGQYLQDISVCCSVRVDQPMRTIAQSSQPFSGSEPFPAKVFGDSVPKASCP